MCRLQGRGLSLRTGGRGAGKTDLIFWLPLNTGHIAHHQFQQPEQDSHQWNAKHPNFGRPRKLVKCTHMLITVNYEFYAIPKPGQPKQPARIAEKQPEVPCRHNSFRRRPSAASGQSPQTQNVPLPRGPVSWLRRASSTPSCLNPAGPRLAHPASSLVFFVPTLSFKFVVFPEPVFVCGDPVGRLWRLHAMSRFIRYRPFFRFCHGRA